jgi:hypothetical protein
MQIILSAVEDAAPIIQWNVDWITILQFVVATLLPLAVAIVTTKVTSSLVKGILLAVFALATTVLSAILDALISGIAVDLGQVLSGALATFVWAVVSYFGIWRAETKSGPSIADRLNADVGRTIRTEPGQDGVYRRAGE